MHYGALLLLLCYCLLVLKDGNESHNKDKAMTTVSMGLFLTVSHLTHCMRLCSYSRDTDPDTIQGKDMARRYHPDTTKRM